MISRLLVAASLPSYGVCDLKVIIAQQTSGSEPLQGIGSAMFGLQRGRRSNPPFQSKASVSGRSIRLNFTHWVNPRTLEKQKGVQLPFPTSKHNFFQTSTLQLAVQFSVLVSYLSTKHRHEGAPAGEKRWPIRHFPGHVRPPGSLRGDRRTKQEQELGEFHERNADVGGAKP